MTTGLKLTEADRLAIIFKKIIAPNSSDPDYRHVENLSTKYREILYRTLGEGKDRKAREYRLNAELLAQGLIDDLEAIKRADPDVDLNSAEIADTWQVFDLAEAYKPLEPLRWLVQGFIAKPSVTIFFGAPKSLKTLLVQDLCLSVASGAQWLPISSGASAGGFSTVRDTILWVDYENGARRMMERFAALAKGHAINPSEARIFTASMPVPWLDAGKKEHIGRLMQRVEHYQAGLLIIDHMAQVLGDVDENSSAMAGVMGNLRSLAEGCKLALILLSHQTKSGTRFNVSMSDSLRGHSSILASCDLALLVERSKESKDAIEIKAVANRGAPIANSSATFAYDSKTDGSLELEKARFWGRTLVSLDRKIELAIIAILKAEVSPINQTALRSAIQEQFDEVGDPAARRAIVRLERAGLIVSAHGSKGALLYSLPEGASDD